MFEKEKIATTFIKLIFIKSSLRTIDIYHNTKAFCDLDLNFQQIYLNSSYFRLC